MKSLERWYLAIGGLAVAGHGDWTFMGEGSEMVGEQKHAGHGGLRGLAVGGWLIALVASLGLMLAVFAGVARAASEIIAAPGSGAGEVNFPLGTAVDQSSGDVYIADANNNRIDKFHSDGEFALAWGFAVRDGETQALQTCGPEAGPPQSWCFPGPFSGSGAGYVSPVAVAVDQLSGDVYVADRSNLRVSKFTSSGQFIFMIGSNVNATKVALGAGATQLEKNICTAASGDTCTSGSFGTGPDEFASPRSLAVTSSGTVWVGDAERLASFDSTGNPGTEIALGGAGNTLSLALSSVGDFYAKSEAFPGIRKLAGPGSLVPGELLETLDASGEARTVTLDAVDNVYVGDGTSPYRFLRFNPGGELTYQFGAGEVLGAPGYPFEGANAISVGEDAGILYSASSTTGEESVVQGFTLPDSGPLIENQGVEGVLPTGAILTGRINPENSETTYWFEYGTGAYEASTATQILATSGFTGEDVEAQLSELVPDTTYQFRVVATSHCNPSVPSEVCVAKGEDQIFTTPPAVIVGPQWATDVTAHSATLHGDLNPLGIEAEAWLEYGSSDSYGSTIPLGNLGEGFAPVSRQAALAGLQSSTTYHFRFVARDVRDGTTYTVYGPDSTFSTRSGTLDFQLADGREWEMVTPPNKHGGRILEGGEKLLQAGAGGDRIAYQSRFPVQTDPAGNRFPEPSMNLAQRDVGGRWQTQDITTPNAEIAGASPGNGTEYKLFRPDLSQALVDPRTGTPLSPEASERTVYLRKDTSPPIFTPLVTAKEPYANVPSGTEFGGQLSLVGVSSNFEHFALRSEVPLVEGVAVSGPTIYEWSVGQIKPVSVLPNGEVVSAPAVGSGKGSVRGAVSADGSRVFWGTGSYPDTNALYVRDTEAEETARLDVLQPGGSGIGAARPVFQGASADGSVVFFSDERRLTADADPKAAGFDLYRCALPPGGIDGGCATLTDISVPTVAGESAEVQGIAAAVSADGKSIYFVAKGVLDGTANAEGDGARPGEPNLYLWSQGSGARFIATLSEQDRTDWGQKFATVPTATVGQLSAAAAPSGRYLAFMSERSLSGYDSHDAVTGEAAQEVFRYDALGDRLECVSCSPAGARPRSAAPPPVDSLVNPIALWAGQRAAATLPLGTTIALEGISLYHPRVVLDNGRVYFNAIDSLVSADSNGQWDAYQYEPLGVGDCSPGAGNAAIARSAGGCVSLISSGTGESEAAFFDAGESGDDAFFFTPAQLNETDTDHEVDIYDARVNGIPATLPKITECLGEACQPAAAAPNDPTPASAAFRGAGNVKPKVHKHCRNGKRLVRRKGKSRCVARKRGHRRHRRAQNHGRAHR